MAVKFDTVKENREFFVKYLLSRTLVRPDDCWIWQKGLNNYGYGHFRIRKFGVCDDVTHRLSYMLFVGAIPEGDITLDHLCRNRRCCNPDHLEPVTRGENVLRGNTTSAANAAKTHCPRGHEYTRENCVGVKAGGRVCKACAREKVKAAYWHHIGLGGTSKQWNSGVRYK